MKLLKTVSLFVVVLLLSVTQKEKHFIKCDNGSCYGEYKGPEFINYSDVAHQFSNKMSAAVGCQLKLLFKAGEYSKVNFDEIEMSTVGMGSGTVTYCLKIPFIKV